MRLWNALMVLSVVMCCWSCGSKQKKKVQLAGKWIGIHLLNYSSDKDLGALQEELPQLKARGVNLIFLEIDYSFNFTSYPELRWGKNVITKKGAAAFAEKCEELGIRLVPEFQCLGHQSWADTTYSLLTKYPELDLTPGAFKGNKDIYCREWDPMNPKVNEIVFELIDEIVEAFNADGIHVGMDEVFLLNDEHAKSTKDKDPAEVFAKVVNEFHEYFVKKKKLEMFIWGDRLIDGEKYSYGEYESSFNQTHGAIDLIPKDIVICDWHYEPKEEYPSVEMFIDKGFRVLPCSFRKPDAVKALIKHSFKINNPQMLGHMFTTWRKIPPKEIADYQPLITGMETIASGKFFDPQVKLVELNYNGSLEIKLNTRQDTMEIKYTTNGFRPGLIAKRFHENILVEEDMVLKAGVFNGSNLMGDIVTQEFYIGKSTGKNLVLTVSPSDKYPAVNKSKSLVDGMLGSESFADGKWLGLDGEDMEAIIDFGSKTKITQIRFNSNNNRDNWVYQADSVLLSVSDDGKKYKKVMAKKISNSEDLVVKSNIKFDKVSCRYAKIRIFHKTIPQGANGAGNPAWLFVDEVVLD